MQKIHDIGLCLDTADIIKMGVSVHTAEKWDKIKDPNDRRRDLYPYIGLKPKYQSLAKVLLFGDMEPGEYYLKSQIINWLPTIPAKDSEAIEQYMITKNKSDFETGEICRVNKEGLPADVKDYYIKEARWILLMSEGYNRYKKELKTLQINSVEQFRSLCISIANSKGMKFGTNLTAFSRDKIKKYQQQGITGLISGKWGNKQAEKISDTSLQTLIDLYAVRTKPDTNKVMTAYNKIAVEMGWKTVTEQTVYNHLQKPEVKQAWTLGRHGLDVWKRDYEYTNHRFRATLPNALWVGDDTKVNLYYYDHKGLKASLQVYAIVDSHSGYWLGRAYAENAKGKSIAAEHVRNAFGDSIVKAGGYMPFQMQYDNDRANSFYERLNSLHFPCMPYNGQSKYIERMFKQVQEKFMSDDAAFTGMNIQSKSDNSKRVGGEMIPYKNKEEAIKAQEMWFEIMNNTPGKDGKSPKEKYFGTVNLDARKMTERDRYEILYEWNQDTITFLKNGLTMIHNKVEYIYNVMSEGAIDVDFYTENVKREFLVKYDPRNMSKVALYTPDKRFITVAVEKNRLAEAVQDYRPGERAMIDESLTAKKLQLGKIRRKLDTASDVSEAENILGTGYRYVSKEIQNQAEADMYTSHQEQQQEVEPELDLEAARRKRIRERENL